MAIVTIDEKYLTQIADSIRQNNGETITYTTSEMPAAIAGLTNKDNGEDTTKFEFDYLFCQLVNGYNSQATKLRPYAFYDMDKLVSIDLPNVTEISKYSFTNCDNLTTINLPSVTEIVGEINNYYFYNCPSLTTINLPNLTTINTNFYVFGFLSSLSTLYLPSLTTIENEIWFAKSNIITKFILPNLQVIGGLGDSGTNPYATLVFPGSTIPVMMNLNLSTGKFGNSYPEAVDYIYVPASMVTAYCNSDWGAFYGSDKIRAIEDYPEVMEGYE